MDADEFQEQENAREQESEICCLRAQDPRGRTAQHDNVVDENEFHDYDSDAREYGGFGCDDGHYCDDLHYLILWNMRDVHAQRITPVTDKEKWGVAVQDPKAEEARSESAHFPAHDR